jgi:Xaa-Pro dipeptidase
MTIGVGGSSAEKELAAMTSMRGDVPPIGTEERLRRIARAQAIMREKGIDALYLDVSSSMVYFTGLNFRRTERMHSAVLPAQGDIVYVSPAFEVEKLKTMTSFGDKIAMWQEDDDPTAVVTETVRSLGLPRGVIAVDEATPFFTFDGLRRAGNSYTFVNAVDVTAGCRMIKSEHEVALMQTAKNITLAAHKAAALIMREGITTTEVQAFLVAAHKKLGSEGRRRLTPSCSARRPPIRTACRIRRRCVTAT